MMMADFKSRGEKSLSGLFAMRFLCAFVLFLMIVTLAPDRLFDPLKAHTAWMAGMCLKAAGMDVTLDGLSIRDSMFSVHIITECTVLFSAGLYACFVLSYPASVSRKVKGILFGLPVLDMINILRIVITFIAGWFNRELFSYVHVYLGEIGMALVTVWSVVIWIRFADGYFAFTPGALFGLKVLILSGLLFFPWVGIQGHYVRAMDVFLGQLFALMGHPVYFTYTHVIYVQTFNIVTFSALVLASDRVGAIKKIFWMTGGLVVIVSMHAAFRTGNVLLTAWHISPSFLLTSLIHLSGQFLVPVLVWFCMISFSDT